MFWRLLPFAILLLFSVGCSRRPTFHAGTILNDPAVAAEARQLVADSFPDSFLATHHVILRVMGEDHQFMGTILVQKPNEIRLRGSSDMGGMLFDLVQNAEGQRAILSNISGIPRNFLLDGALADVANVYLAMPTENALLYTHGEDEVYLEDTLGRRQARIFLFDRDPLRWTGLNLVENERVNYELKILEAGPTSRTVEVLNPEMHYHATVRIADVKERTIDRKVFEIP